MKIAALDLGSNSSLLLIVEIENSKIIEVYHDEQMVTRLGQGVHESRSLHPEALKRAEECFSHYKKIIDAHDVDIVQAVSTSAARDVSNKDEFINLGKKYSIPIQIISGPLEAELTYSGSIASSKSSASVIDVGGGSTEIIGINEGSIKGYSLDIGSVRLAEIHDAFDDINEDTLTKIDEYILSEINKHKNKLPVIDSAVAVAGTPTTLSCILQDIEFDVKKVEFYFISLDELRDSRIKLAKMSLADRKKIKGIHPDRADVLPCGVSILLNICEYFNLKGFSVSCRGVRYGLALALESGDF